MSHLVLCTFDETQLMIKRLLILLGRVLVAQFIRPDRSVQAHDPGTDLLAMTQAPADISTSIKGACYDCHSYETEYLF